MTFCIKLNILPYVLTATDSVCIKNFIKEAHDLFLYSLKSKKSFYILKWLKKRSKEHSLWQVKITTRNSHVLTNKVLFEHIHVHSFMYYWWLLSHYNGRFDWFWQKPYGLSRKSLPTSIIRHNGTAHCSFLRLNGLRVDSGRN